MFVDAREKPGVLCRSERVASAKSLQAYRLNLRALFQPLLLPGQPWNELDLLCAAGRQLVGVETKSSATYHSSFKKALTFFGEQIAPLERSYLVYNGQPQTFGDGVVALPFSRVSEIQ